MVAAEKTSLSFTDLRHNCRLFERLGLSTDIAAMKYLLTRIMTGSRFPVFRKASGDVEINPGPSTSMENQNKSTCKECKMCEVQCMCFKLRRSPSESIG